MTRVLPPRAASLLRLAVRNLLVHKLRSTLSIVGVVFGVGAVTAVSAVGEGARREALDQIGDLGIDTITVRAKASADGAPAARCASRTRPPCARSGADVVAVAPVREATAPVQGAGRTTDAGVVGTTADYASAARLRISSGRFLAGLDVEQRKRVAVLGASVASDLFPLTDPRGQRVLVGGDWYDVVGVAEGRGSRRGRGGPIRSRDVNRAVFVPLLSLDRGGDPRPDGIDEIVLRVDDARNVSRSAEVVKAVVRRTSGSDAFDVIVPREILRQKERTQRIFNVVTGAIAAISLLVGGIGIMNIMLASVAERTREVGIRRAVGASRRDIAAQFLVESSLLTATGGVLGTLLGIVGSFAIQRLAGWPTALSLGDAGDRARHRDRGGPRVRLLSRLGGGAPGADGRSQAGLAVRSVLLRRRHRPRLAAHEAVGVRQRVPVRGLDGGVLRLAACRPSPRSADREEIDDARVLLVGLAQLADGHRVVLLREGDAARPARGSAGPRTGSSWPSTAVAYAAAFALAAARSLRARATRASSKRCCRRVASFTWAATSALSIAATCSSNFAAASSTRPASRRMLPIWL